MVGARESAVGEFAARNCSPEGFRHRLAKRHRRRMPRQLSRAATAPPQPQIWPSPHKRLIHTFPTRQVAGFKQSGGTNAYIQLPPLGRQARHAKSGVRWMFEETHAFIRSYRGFGLVG